MAVKIKRKLGVVLFALLLLITGVLPLFSSFNFKQAYLATLILK